MRLRRFAGFVQFSLWFLVFVNNDVGFSLILLFRARRFSFFPFLAMNLFAGYGFFCPMHFTVFLVLPRKLYPTVALKLQFQGPLTYDGVLPFLLEEWMTCLVCLVAVIWVVTPGGGGRVTPIYGLYRYVPRNRVWFLGSRSLYSYKRSLRMRPLFCVVMLVNNVTYFEEFAI